MPVRKGGEEELTTPFPLDLLLKALISFPSITMGFTKRWKKKKKKNSTGQGIKGGDKKGEKKKERRRRKKKEHLSWVYSG